MASILKNSGSNINPSDPHEAELARAEAAFDNMRKGQAAVFEEKTELPVLIEKAKKENPIPLFGYYGDQFYASKPSAELVKQTE
jgi:hypothetical protein